jgi:hypothetical protein
MGGIVSAATIELPQTGQTTCYSAGGTEIDCACTGQDGATQVGAVLPVPRFTTDYYGLTVVDNLTGLMWTFDSRTPDPYDPGPPICAPDGRTILEWVKEHTDPVTGDKYYTYPVLDYISCLNTNNFLGYNDWRLPNREEVRSLVFDLSASAPALPAGYPFINVEGGYNYWSSTSTFDWSWNEDDEVWELQWTFGIGSMNMWSGSEFSGGEFVWPVRAGVTDGNPDPAYPANLRKTGQNISAGPGDDGDLDLDIPPAPGRAGVAWPDPRFTVIYCDASGPCTNPAEDCDLDPSNDVVTDNLTGLIWIRLPDNIHRTWEESLAYANDLDRCGYSNWRLPNINELTSMIHNGEQDIAVWLNASPPDYFIGIESWFYWSSTTDRASRGSAMGVDLWDGSITKPSKSGRNYAWAVHLAGPVLTVLQTGEGSGTVTSTPPGIVCGCDCSETYLVGTEVTLTAVAEDGSIFEGWSGACTGTGTCTVTLNADTEVTASFSRGALLTVLKTGGGSGTVTSIPPGIDCGSDCSETYLVGTEVTLTAVAEDGSIFEGWSGACTGTGTCIITLNVDIEVTASFSKLVLLTVLKTGEGSGTVTSTPLGIVCGPDCSQAFLEGTEVTLTAAAQIGSIFDGWSGGCTGTGTCTMTLNADAEVTASFSRPYSGCTYSITPKTKTFAISGLTIPEARPTLKIAVVASDNDCPEPSLDFAEDWIDVTVTSWDNKRGVVTVTVDPSWSSMQRVSTVGIGNATFTAIQKKRSCTPGGVPPTFTPSNQIWSADGGTGSFAISFAPKAAVDCMWSAQPDAETSWASTDSSGVGNGTVEYSVDENLSAAIRYGKINVTLTQQPLKIFRFKLRQLD